MESSTRDQSEDLNPFQTDMQKCPLLRNIDRLTNLSLSSSMPFPMPLFHGNDGVIPRSEKKELASALPEFDLASRGASISLSSWNIQKKTNLDFSKKESSLQGGPSDREASRNGWLQTGNCPIARSYRAVSSVMPLVANVLKHPAGAKLHCPPVVVATRAAISQIASGKNPQTQPLGAKISSTGMLSLKANVSIGIWGELTEKISPPWFSAVLSAVPFIAMLGKSAVMSMSDMAFTIGASVLGQVIGSRAKRNLLKAVAAKGIHISEKGATSSSQQEWTLQVSSRTSNSPESCRKSFNIQIDSAKSHSRT